MPQLLKFYYEAISIDGKTVDGVEMASSLEEVILKLLQNGLYPSRIESLNEITGIAYERLSRLKQLRDRLSPPSTTKPQPKPKSPVKKSNLLIAVIVLVWAILIALYMLL